MNRKRMIIILLIVGVVLLGAAGVLFAVSRGSVTTPTPTPSSPLPDLEVTPPASLEELAAQYPSLASVLADPELGTVYKEFLIAYQEGGEAAAIQLAKERGVLTPDEQSLRVTLVLDTQDHTALVQQLEAIGVTVVSAYEDRVNVSVPMALVAEELQSEHPGAIFTQLTELKHVIAVRLPEPNVLNQERIEGEGVEMINAKAWHEAGLTGKGVRIGVLDLGFAGHEDLLGTELPERVPLQTFGWYDATEVHGTACAEIIHEVAPEADLVFAWYDGSEAAMGEAVAWLLEQDVDIISHSAGALVGPRDGSGWKAQLVDDVASQGVLWVNASGNEALNHYRATFTDTDGDGIHEFAPGEELLALYNAREALAFVQWDDSWEQPTRDYELYFLNADGEVLAASEDPQSGEVGQYPAEGISYATGGETVYAVVVVYQSDAPVTLDIFTGPEVEIDNPSPAYSLSPPSDAIGALTVGAVNWWDDELADYSSQGPTTDERLKPEISAPAGVSGSTYGAMMFEGTSASTPHVAGAAALVWQAYPGFSRQEVVDYLLSESKDRGPRGPDTGYGYGRLQLPRPPEAVEAPTTPPPATSEPIGSSLAPEPTSTPAPLPTPTEVAYTTPEPPAPERQGRAVLGPMTVLGLLVGGFGCCGAGLVLIAAVLLISGARRRKPAPPPAAPQAPVRVAPGTPPAVQKPRPPAPAELPPTRPIEARCPNCGAPLHRPDAHFCATCGHPLTPQEEPRICQYCGAAIHADAKFCARCGHPVNSA